MKGASAAAAAGLFSPFASHAWVCCCWDGGGAGQFTSPTIKLSDALETAGNSSCFFLLAVLHEGGGAFFGSPQLILSTLDTRHSPVAAAGEYRRAYNEGQQHWAPAAACAASLTSPTNLDIWN
jgi:hypothetical protein